MSANKVNKNDLLQGARALLEKSGIENSALEARILLAWAAQCDRMGLLRIETFPAEVISRFYEGIRRRAAREPMAFIIGEQGFWTLDLWVSLDTLIPRADSETLIEALLSQCPDRKNIQSILDLGTGTGCLLLSALSEYSDAFGIGVDISSGATSLARRNAMRNKLDDRASFITGSWAESLQGPFDVVLSNPPYIEHGVMKGLMPEVQYYEPHRALDGGDDGLVAYRILCQALPRLVARGGCAVFELGIGQEEAVTQLAEEQGFVKVACVSDLGGIPRALVLEWKQKEVGLS